MVILNFWEMPMILNIIIPTIAVFLFVAFLLWEARLPTERRVLHQLRMTRRHKTVKQKVH
jgi:hypothetical protein